MKSRALAAIVGVFLASAGVASAAPQAVSFGQWGQLGVELPAGWSVEAGPPVRIAAPEGATVLELTAMAVPAPGRADELEEELQKLAEEAKAKLGAAEVSELAGEGLRALYASATDAAKATYVDEGAAVAGRLLVGFTVRGRGESGAARAQALAVVKSAKYVPPGPPWVTPKGGVALAYPGKKWRVALDLPGYELQPARLAPDGKGVRLAARNAATRMIVTVILQESPAGRTAVEQREDAWKKMVGASEQLDRTDVKRSERDGMAMLEYAVPKYEGMDVNQHTVSAYLVRDGVWIDVHLSKVAFKESEKDLFEKVIASVRFEE